VLKIKILGHVVVMQEEIEDGFALRSVHPAVVLLLVNGVELTVQVLPEQADEVFLEFVNVRFLITANFFLISAFVLILKISAYCFLIIRGFFKIIVQRQIIGGLAVEWRRRWL